MPKYVAFLRAINVGGHTVKMDHLRGLLTAIGLESVETFIASGNVIFDASSRSGKALERKIEGCLRAALGYEVATFVRSTAELAALANYQPFPESDLNAAGQTLYIGFMAGAPDDSAEQKLARLNSKVDEFHLFGREVYWMCRARFSESEVSGAQLAKALGRPLTLRNSTTVRKIAAKYP